MWAVIPVTFSRNSAMPKARAMGAKIISLVSISLLVIFFLCFLATHDGCPGQTDQRQLGNAPGDGISTIIEGSVVVQSFGGELEDIDLVRIEGSADGFIKICIDPRHFPVVFIPVSAQVMKT